ncbi:MAG: protein kinase [Deltaproteobacteria bacterium]|nr:protein kinase [Deltaproteobacteria bacterium]
MAIKKIKTDYYIGIFVLLIFIAFTYYNWSLLDTLDSYLYNTGSRLIGSEDNNINNVVIINIDNKSIGKSSQNSKTPLVNLKDLTDGLTDNGVKLIVFSMPFEPDQTSMASKELRALSEEISAYPPGKKSPEFREWILQNIEAYNTRVLSTSLFPDILKDGSNIIVPVTDVGTDSVDLRIADYLNASNIDTSFIKKNSVDKLVFPYPGLLNTIAGSGYISGNGEGEQDDISYQVYVFYKGSMVPSLALRMAIFFNNLKPAQVKANQSGIMIRDKVVPLINGRMYVPASDNKIPIKTFNYEQIMNNPKEMQGLKDKVVVIGLKDGKKAIHPDAAQVARQFMNIINNNAVSRAPYMVYLEAFLFVVLVFLLISLTSSKGFLARSFITVFIILLIIGAVISCFTFAGVWFKAANIICGVVFFYILLSFTSGTPPAVKKGSETSRILGLNFQSQGELDLAYEEFKTLPLDKETKDLIYNLGLEYEKNNQPEKALELYVYINKGGGFRDLDDRIPMLRASDYSSTMGRYGDVNESTILGDSSVDLRSMVGRYKIIGKLGKGSMGLVYKAQDPKINRLVAIKTIRFSDEFDEDVIKEIKERFFREAEIAGKLSHPAIVTIHDVGDDRDLTYMAMEYLEGEDLDKYIKKGNLLPVRSVLNIVTQIAEALDFAHKQGVIHRDIKPANVMLLSNGQVKVTDFGIAKAISSSKTKTGVILGTPNYMSPEQIMGQKVNSKSDIFSLGVLFYQLLTGELPFHGDNLSGLLYQITQVKHSSPRGYNKKVPKVCEQILDKALTKDPAKRFRTAGEMAHIIRILGEKMDQLQARKNEA